MKCVEKQVLLDIGKLFAQKKQALEEVLIMVGRRSAYRACTRISVPSAHFESGTDIEETTVNRPRTTSSLVPLCARI